MRELTATEIDEFLRRHLVGRVGCHADGLTYVVPVIYAFHADAVYVATIEGQKVTLMRANPDVCFEVDEYDAGNWRSVIVQGHYEELDGADAEAALALLAARFAAEGRGRRRPAASGRATVCFRIRVHEATGRAMERTAATAENRTA